MKKEEEVATHQYVMLLKWLPCCWCYSCSPGEWLHACCTLHRLHAAHCTYEWLLRVCYTLLCLNAAHCKVERLLGVCCNLLCLDAVHCKVERLQGCMQHFGFYPLARCYQSSILPATILLTSKCCYSSSLSSVVVR